MRGPPHSPQTESAKRTAKVDNAVYSRLTARSRNMDDFYREDLKRVLYGVDDGLNRYADSSIRRAPKCNRSAKSTKGSQHRDLEASLLF